MKKLTFDELLLVSHTERRAKKVVFHPKATVIQGPNDTGKSSIVKSIFYALGANPSSVHPRWKKADVSSLLRFSVNGYECSLFRHGQSFSLFLLESRFLKREHLIGTYDSVTNQLGPKLAELFDFKLILLSQDGAPQVPPPAYLFLPYYIDQDIGWAKNWSSFENLSQFKNWRRDLVYYHTGIHPNKWYELKTNARVLQKDREDPIQREKILKDVLKQLERQLSNSKFDIDIKAYKKEINDLLKRCEVLKKKEEEYKNKLIELETERIRLEAQKDIVAHARLELSEDYDFADKVSEDNIACPICGAVYSNTFAERFSIACDEDRCVSLLQQIRKNLDEIVEKICNHKNGLTNTSIEIDEINAILMAKQGELTLKDLIENEGKREVSSTLNSNLEEIRAQIAKIETMIREIDEELSKYSDPKRSQEIISLYRERMSRHLSLLNVTTLDESSFRKLESSIKETGSDQPRAILAYFFSILHVIKSYGTSVFCPIVIDAPNQQEQDPHNHRKMLEFIKGNMTEDSQLILSLVDDCGIDFGGTIIPMEEKNFALSKEEYKNVAEEIEPYLAANLGI